MIDSVQSWIEQIRSLGLLSDEQLAEVEALGGDAAADPDRLAEELIKRGWLTSFQINQLALGRGNELVLDQYVLLSLLGEGGMGQVFKARQKRMKRLVALKVIRRECLARPGAVERFCREAEAAARMAHPNVVTVFDTNEVNGNHFLVMEYLEGTDLARCVKERGLPPAALACEYIRQSALGLQHAHDRGLVHRDIKPANLMLTSEGYIKVMDLGLARLAEAADQTSLTATGAVMGTPDYIAPEQAINSKSVDLRADIYSLGCSLYYLLTGLPPFPGNSVAEKLLKHHLHQPEPVESRRSDLPAELPPVLRRMMAKQPDDRFPTMAAVAAALTPFCKVEDDAQAAWTAGVGAVEVGDIPTNAGPGAPIPPTVSAIGNKADSVQDTPRRPPAPPLPEKPSDTPAAPTPPGTLPAGLHAPTMAVTPTLAAPRRKKPLLFLAAIVFTLALLGGLFSHSLVAWLNGVGPASGLAERPVATSNEATAPATLRSTIETPPTPPPSRPDKYALLVGVGKSTTGQLESLPFAETDVQEVADALCAGGYRPEAVRALTTTAGASEPAQTPGIANVRRALEAMRRERLAADSVIVALSGPVIQFKGESEAYFCPADANLADKQTLLSLSQVYDDLRKCRAGFKLLLIDGCRSRPLTPKAPAEVEIEEVARPQTRTPPDGVAVLFASTPGETSYDRTDLRQGVFFSFVAQAMRKPESRLEDFVRQSAFAYVYRSERRRSGRQTPDRGGITGGPPPLACLEGFTVPEPIGEIFSSGTEGHLKAVTAVAVTPNGRLALSTSPDTTVRLWDLMERKQLERGLDTDVVSPGWGVAVAPDARTAVVATGGVWKDEKLDRGTPLHNTIHLLEIEGKRELDGPSGHEDFVSCVAFSSDGRLIASGSFDKTVRLWSVSGGKLKAGEALKLQHTGKVRGVAFAPDNKWLVSVGTDGLLVRWDLPGGKATKLSGPGKPLLCVTVAPDSRLIAVGGEEGLVALWDAATGKRITAFPMQKSAINGVAFSPEGDRLLTAGADKTVRLWDLQGKELYKFEGHTGPVTCVAFTPDGRRAVSGSEDRTVRLWALPRQE